MEVEAILRLLGRPDPLFREDLGRHEVSLREMVGGARFLVIGGAGSIGQAVVREIFRRTPRALHVVDVSENNLVELVRDLRSSLGYFPGDFRTFAIDCGDAEFAALARSGVQYDYVLNLSALKHVRSEKDPYTLMRMARVNIMGTVRSAEAARSSGARKFFSVSTDKAANPVNMMGASKRIMEMFLMRASELLPVSTARFANVAFSDGSLLHGFSQRFSKQQPIAAPSDVRRYFITPRESGELCLLSCLLGTNRDMFFPKPSPSLQLTSFPEIAQRFLAGHGFEPHECATEEEARARCQELIAARRWPCYFFASDTTGEKDFEEFYGLGEQLDMERFANVGVICNPVHYDGDALDRFASRLNGMIAAGTWTRSDIVALFKDTVPEFSHLETGKFLDERM